VAQQELCIPFLLLAILQLIDAFDAAPGKMATGIAPADAAHDAADARPPSETDARASRRSSAWYD
jgi:hypothetical protein